MQHQSFIGPGRLTLAVLLCLGAAADARAARLDITLVPNTSSTGVSIDAGAGSFLIDDALVGPQARVSFADIIVDLEIGGFRFDRSLQPDDEAVIFGAGGLDVVEVEDGSTGRFINLTNADRSADLLIQEGLRFTGGALADAFAFTLILPIGTQAAPNVQFTGRMEIARAPAVVPLPPSLYSFAAVLAALAFWNARRRASTADRAGAAAAGGARLPSA